MARRCRFVDPETQRLSLSDDEWIEVKCELTAGESRELFGRMRPFVKLGEEDRFIAKEISMARVSAYLVDWSFVDAAGKRVAVTDAAIDMLNLATFTEITRAIDDHEAAMDAQRVAEKNGQAGSRKLAAI